MNKIRIFKKEKSKDKSIKFFYKTSKGDLLYSVLILKENGKYNYCISCQIGCTNKCLHCATGKVNYSRDMTSDEIFAQVNLIKKNNKLNDRILFMGMGEPLLNYDNVIKTCKLFIEKSIIKSFKDIIISTSGIIDGIKKLGIEKDRPRLAVTIGFPDQKRRELLIPHSKIYKLELLMNECLNFQEKTGDEIIFEYPLIKNYNDSMEDIKQFINLIKDFRCEIHIIPFNEFKKSKFKRPSEKRIKEVIDILKNNDIYAFDKPSYGIDIYAGCGQLET